MRLLAGAMASLIAASAATITMLRLTGQPRASYYWPPIVMAMCGLVLAVVLWRRRRGVPVLVTAGIATVSLAVAATNSAAALITLAVFAFWALIWIPPATRRRRARAEVAIARDPRSVFDYVSDLRHLREYARGVRSVEKLTKGPIGEGTRFRVQLGTGTARFEETDQVTRCAPSRRFEWRSSDGSGGTAVETVSFEREASHTRVTHQAVTQEPYELAVIGMGIVNPVLAVVGSWERRANLERLKRVLEDASPG